MFCAVLYVEHFYNLTFFSKNIGGETDIHIYGNRLVTLRCLNFGCLFFHSCRVRSHSSHLYISQLSRTGHEMLGNLPIPVGHFSANVGTGPYCHSYKVLVNSLSISACQEGPVVQLECYILTGNTSFPYGQITPNFITLPYIEQWQ